MSFLHSITDPQAIVSAFGLFGVLAIIFLETGAFFGFFLPGDSLLFTAGLLASQGFIPPAWLFLGAFAAAVLGDSVGYAFGHKIGPAIFTKDDSIFFSKKNVDRAQQFYTAYGTKTIILARFVPVVRTFAPILAGVGSMKYKTFLTYNIVGGFIWTLALIGLGFGFGRIIPADKVDTYLLPAIGVIIVISILPAIRELLKKKPVV